MELSSMIIALLSALISLVSIIVSVITYKKTVVHERKKDTIEAFGRLQNEVLDKITSSKKDIISITSAVGSDEYRKLSVYLARIEHFCVGINEDIYDIDVLKSLAGRYFIGLYERLCPLIEKKRKINRLDIHYSEFEKTIEGLKKRYRNSEHKRG